jgi:apolipoprotein N-acyltransferase
MDRIASRVIVLWGWRRLAVAAVAGAVSALALPPLNLFPVLFATVPVLVWLIDGAMPRPDAGLLGRFVPAAAVGWWFGFGYFLGGLWWIGAAFLVDAEQFAWMLPVAVVILPAGLALFFGAGAGLARLFWPEGWPRILVFAAAMSAAEWLRGHILTGFPWNAFGYALAPTPVMMQSAALVGLWGLTLFAFIIFAAPAALAGHAGRNERGGRLLAVAAALLLVLHVGYGAVRLAFAGPPGDGPSLRIVQPALDQSEKWQAENEAEIVGRYLRLSDGATLPVPGAGGATILIWPESAFPFVLTERPEVLTAIAALLPEGVTLITGAVRADPGTGRAALEAYNSVYVIGDDGVIEAAYDKVRLVPFGEFLPFRPLLEALGIRQLIAIPEGFVPGARRLTLAVESAPSLAPLICYEIIFPGAVLASGPRPGWLLNLTNDTWFGDTPGPHQHFLQARLRAVEEGLPLVRAANSGISAIVDGYGRVENSLGIGTAGVVDGSLPTALPPPPYARSGDWIFLALWLGIALAGLAGRPISPG